jgi:hypothetical protein
MDQLSRAKLFASKNGGAFIPYLITSHFVKPIVCRHANSIFQARPALWVDSFLERM